MTKAVDKFDGSASDPSSCGRCGSALSLNQSAKSSILKRKSIPYISIHIKMSDKNSPPNCYCGLWESNPEILEAQQVPRGFCGICEMCGEPGHTRHYPGPVPSTGSWCDVCYKVQAHLGPIRDVGVWYFNTETLEERFIEGPKPDAARLQELITSLTTPRSALIVELSGNIGIDFIVQGDKSLNMECSQRKAGFFAFGNVDISVAKFALSVVLDGQDFQNQMRAAGVKLTYYDDEDGYMREY